MKIHPIAFDFLLPYIEPYCELVDAPAEADFILTMNNAGHEGADAVRYARDTATSAGRPLCWWTIEDPNGYGQFLPQAHIADHVFTSDGEMVPIYKLALGHDRVHWLPLAACEKYHRPLPLLEDATDFVFSGNWYRHPARDWAVETVILPLAAAGYSITVFSLDEPPYSELIEGWVRPEDPRNPGYFSAVAEQYRWGKVVLGVNNQRSGMHDSGTPLSGPPRGKTTMTSMRTFEALACGKAFLASHSDAYEALGFERGLHLAVAADVYETTNYAAMLADPERAHIMGDKGRSYVLANHTYGHRMEAIMEAIE